MTLLSRLQTLGMGPETTPGTYVVPTIYVPALDVAFGDHVDPLRNEAIMGNDTVLQSIIPGPAFCEGMYKMPHLYPDAIGAHLRAIIGPDTLTAGVATTLSANTAAAATSITTAASIPAASTIMIDTGVNVEYAVTGTPSGAGPFTIPITSPASGLRFAHLSAVAVVAASSHAIKSDSRATPIKSYSFTNWTGAEAGGLARGYPGCYLGELGIKIDGKGAVTVDPKWTGFPSATQAKPTAAYSAAEGLVGWQWSMILGGVASTRGLTLDITLKRALERLDSSDGTQGPREIWPDALEVDYRLSAIFENTSDQAPFLNYFPNGWVTTITQPGNRGGGILTLTSTKEVHTKFEPDATGKFLRANIEGSGLYSSTDVNAIAANLTNFVATAF